MLERNVKTKIVMKRVRGAEALYYLISGLLILAWAAAVVADILVKAAKPYGGGTLAAALAVLALISLSGSIAALRGRAFASPTASVLLVALAALRAIQLFSIGSLTVVDADVLGGIALASAWLYFGTPRLWWLLLMPLSIAASVAPLVWLEYFRGASDAVLRASLVMPSIAFAGGSLLIVARDLRSLSRANIARVRALGSRSSTTMQSLRAMESDLKRLREILSGELVELAPVTTTDFNAAPIAPPPTASETVSFDEIDASARRLLEEARAAVEGRPVRLSLTAPTGTGLPVAIRGSMSEVTAWLKSAILNSIEALGGFPDGMVRVELKPGLNTLTISVEDNGRGFGESLLSKMGQASDRMTLADVRAAVERTGGRFDIQARLGVGSRLSMELPRVDAFVPGLSLGVSSGVRAGSGTRASLKRAIDLPVSSLQLS